MHISNSVIINLSIRNPLLNTNLEDKKKGQRMIKSPDLSLSLHCSYEEDDNNKKIIAVGNR